VGDVTEKGIRMFFGMRDDYRRGQVAIAALFVFLGFQYASWTSRLPALTARLHLTTGDVGLLLLACGVGAAASFPLVGVLMRRLGSRTLSWVSALFLVLCLLSLVGTPSYPVTFVIMVCDGVAIACLDVAMNAQGAALEARHGRTTMGKLHATFSGGSLAAALLASAVSKLTPSLAVHFGVAALILLLLVGYARPGLLAEDLRPEEPQRHERRRFAVPSRMTLLLGIAMAFATVTEGAMNDWSALYLKDVAHAASAVTPLGVAVFSATMVLARVFADGWRSRWGDRRVVLVGSVLAAAGLAVGLLLGGAGPALFGFACVGLGVAAVAPCVYVVGARQGGGALTLVSAMGTTGMLVGPPVIGAIAGASNLAWGMVAVAGSAVVVALCATRIRWPAPTPAGQPGG
jgi:MFS family permease